MGRGRVLILQRRKGKRDGDGREAVIDKHIDGLGTDVRKMGSNITTIMNNQSIDRQGYEEMILLVMISKNRNQVNLIRKHIRYR